MKNITITRTQKEEIENIIKGNCFAVAYELTCKYLFGKIPKEIQHSYNSAEYNTSRKIVSAVYYNYKYLKVIEG